MGAYWRVLGGTGGLVWVPMVWVVNIGGGLGWGVVPVGVLFIPAVNMIVRNTDTKMLMRYTHLKQEKLRDKLVNFH